MEGRADGCEREAGRARTGVEGSGVKHCEPVRGVVAEGKNRTERAVVLIPVANREN